MEELGQLIIAVIFILFYALSATRKKKKPVPPAMRRRPQQPVHTVAPPAVTVESNESEPEPLRPPADWELPDGKETPAEKPVERKRSLAEELLGMLQEQAVPVSEPTVRLYEMDDEAQSLETDESVHLQSVEELPAESPYAVDDGQAPQPYVVESTPDERPYVVEETPAPKPYAIPDAPKRKRDLTRSELRHAFVMREVLGPPKALEE